MRASRPRIPSIFLAGCLLVGAPVLSLAAPDAGFAVVELFTSEGCSSCPPADEALSTIADAAASEHLPVYVLEWHVDYWDYLGWKDPYDSHLASSRQYRYAQALHSSVYTPQAIVNGVAVPSWAGDPSELRSIEQRYLAARPSQAIRLDLRTSVSGRSVDVRARLQGAPGGTQLLLALLETGLGGTPTSGENRGRRLRHSQVVRDVAMLPASGGEASLQLPAGADARACAVVGLVQDPSTMRILAAGRATLLDSTGASISGRVLDSNGRPVAGLRVQVCSDRACIPAVTDARGAFTLKVPAGTYSLSLEEAPAFRQITVVSGQLLQLDAIRMERPAGS